MPTDLPDRKPDPQPHQLLLAKTLGWSFILSLSGVIISVAIWVMSVVLRAAQVAP